MAGTKAGLRGGAEILSARPRCQFEGLPLRPTPPLGAVRRSRLLRERLRERFRSLPQPGGRSAYEVGDWVRVKDTDAVKATLDDRNRLHGLWFTDGQWAFCGRTYQVEHSVRRMVDDHYRMRRISRTVTLAGATCLGPHGDQGCGLACALLFRDDWLEPATAELAEPRPSAAYATVRPLAEIQATLDAHGTLDGVPFQPGMAAHTGTRHPVLTHVQHRALPRWQHPTGDWYILDRLRCSGQPLAGSGCDRQCGLLWHRSWLDLDES